MQEIIPFVESFQIGSLERTGVASAPLYPGRVERDHTAEIINPLFGVVENNGPSAFTFSVEASSDDGVTDAYAALDIRINGVDVSDVEVVPGGRVVFTIEGGEAWVRTKVAEVPAHGRVALAYWAGKLVRHDTEA